MGFHCSDCGRHVKHLLQNEPQLCHSCGIDRVYRDFRVRKSLPPDARVGIMIFCSPPDAASGSCRQVPIAAIPEVSRLKMGRTRMLRHSMRAQRWRAMVPVLDAITCDPGPTEDLPPNTHGLNVLRALGCFDARVTGTLFGPIFITGPSCLSLMPAEVERIENLVKCSGRGVARDLPDCNLTCQEVAE
jgi:hypothetical protein